MTTLNNVGLRTSAKVKDLNIGITRSQTPAHYESRCYLNVGSLIYGALLNHPSRSLRPNRYLYQSTNLLSQDPHLVKLLTTPQILLSLQISHHKPCCRY